jgi:hypothetical protein
MLLFGAKEMKNRFNAQFDFMLICPGWIERWAKQEAEGKAAKDQNNRISSSLKAYKRPTAGKRKLSLDSFRGGLSRVSTTNDHKGCPGFTFLHEMSHSYMTMGELSSECRDEIFQGLTADFNYSQRWS